MSDIATGQVSRSAADIYEDFFVPALFRQWAPKVLDAGRVGPGDRVLDVACGTGVLAREAAERVGDASSVLGLDRNDGMLAVARRQAPAVEWRLGMAEALPFEDGSYDVVLSQFGLMFFEDRIAALGEMWRVLRPGGRLAVAVWDALERSPGYFAMAELLQRLFGDRVADELRAPFVLGDPEKLCRLMLDAGIVDVEIETLPGTARFPSLAAWLHTDVKGWTLADHIDELQFRDLVQEAKTALEAFVCIDGTVSFEAPAHIAKATRN